MKNNNSVEQFYKSQYAEEGLHDLGQRHQLLIGILESFIGKQVLEIGCGNGGFAQKVSSHFHLERIYGIDISADAINAACGRGIIASRVNLDLEDLPFEEVSFDTVICGDVIEHLISPDHLLEEIHRVLKAQGHLLITTPNLASWYNRLLLLFGHQPFFSDVSIRYPANAFFTSSLPHNHLHLFTLRSLVFLLQKYDFRIVKRVGVGINTMIGYGKKFKWLAMLLNVVFRSASVNSEICIIAKKA